MKLTAKQVLSLKPKDKTYRIADGKGLCLQVEPNGSKYWRLRYYFLDKAKMLALGVYPEISLKEARELTFKSRELLKQGLDPVQFKKEKKLLNIEAAKNTFEAVAIEWIETQKEKWTEKYQHDFYRRLELHIFPHFGNKPINEISPQLVLAAIRAMEKRGLGETTTKVLQRVNAVFRYAVITNRCDYNPAQDLSGALAVKPKVQHRASLSKPELPAFFQALNDCDNIQNIIALKLQFYTLTRPSEVGNAVWSEFDLDNAVWIIPEHRMKMKKEHKVSLPKQAVELLNELHIMNGAFEHLFINRNDHSRPISENTLTKQIQRLGFKATSHGIRATGSTILNEQGFNSDAIEKQLAHQ